MNGAEAIVSLLARNGIDLCFSNPGTTELALVDALDRAKQIRCVLGLFEGVCTGAADGYARMLGRPAATLLHLGPGFANGIANLHNARRARSAILNLVGDHATWHLPYDAPLASDIRSLAVPVSGHYAYLADPERSVEAMAQAMDAARSGVIASVVIPTDVQEHAFAEAPAIPVLPVRSAAGGPGEGIEAGARALRARGTTIILLGAGAMTAAAQQAAAGIAAATGARVFAETFPARWDRGGDIPVIPRFPYFPEMGIATLKDADSVLLVGAKAPIAYFGKTGLPSELARPGTQLVTLADPGEDATGAIRALAHVVGAVPLLAPAMSAPPPAEAGHRLDLSVMAQTVAALLPERAIVAVEGATTTPFFTAAAAAAPHTLLTNTGGAIGQGMPVATGAALACPDRPVINLQDNRSAAYTLQALWTQAREKLNVVTVLCANKSYGVLRVELQRAGMRRRIRPAAADQPRGPGSGLGGACPRLWRPGGAGEHGGGTGRAAANVAFTAWSISHRGGNVMLQTKASILIVAALATVSLLGVHRPACAQAASSGFAPTRPVTLVVPFAAGGGTDVLARLVAEKLGAAVKQTVLVDNRPGANGLVASQFVEKAKADGQTLMLGSNSTYVIAPLLLPDRAAAEAMKSKFTLVAILAGTPLVLAVNETSEYETLEQFLAKKDAELTFGTFGVHSSPHLMGALLASRTGLRLVHVPYKGSAPAVTDLLGGTINSVFLTVAGISSFVEGKQVRALAVTGKERLASLPDVPTFQERGISGLENSGWFAIFAPANLPETITADLRGIIGNIMRQPDMRDKVSELGLQEATIVPGKEVEVWNESWNSTSEILKQTGIHLN